MEIQGFPSLYAYQPELAEQYRESYELDGVAYLIEEAGSEEIIASAPSPRSG